MKWRRYKNITNKYGKLLIYVILKKKEENHQLHQICQQIYVSKTICIVSLIGQ